MEAEGVNRMSIRFLTGEVLLFGDLSLLFLLLLLGNSHDSSFILCVSPTIFYMAFSIQMRKHVLSLCNTVWKIIRNVFVVAHCAVEES